MASPYYAQRDAYNRSPSPLYHHQPPPPPAGGAPFTSLSTSPTQPLRYLPPSQAHRQNTAPPAPYYPPSPASHNPPSPHAPPPPHSAHDPDEPSCIKCSSCAAWVRLEDLGGHVCAVGRQREDRRAPPEGLRLERGGGGSGAGAGWHGQGGGRSPLMPGQYVHASPPGSAPLPLATPSPNGTARLPFFDRYQKLVDTSETAVGNMAGVGSARSPRLAPGGGGGGGGFPYALGPPPPQRSTTSPLPFSTSVSAPNLAVPAPHTPYYPETQQRRRADEQAFAASSPSPTGLTGLYRQASPVSFRSATSEWSAAAAARRDYAGAGASRQDTPDSSVAPSSSPSSRKASAAGLTHGPAPPTRREQQQLERAPSQALSASSSYLPYDRDSLPQSRSTPADLGASWWTGGANGLDACLADLRLMAEGEDDVGLVGEETLEELFERPGQRGQEEGSGKSHEEGFTAEDLLATPRQSPKREKLPPPSSPSLSPSSASPSPSPSSDPLTCTACHAPLPPSQTPRRVSAGPPFCRPCYADRFLPKCRRCALPIEGGAVTSSDGKIAGKYHPRCFACWACGADFPAGEFYVFDGKPYCQQDYHALNGSLCADPRCGKPIEGSCVSLIGEDKGDGGRYHPPCFNCSDPSCLVPLLSHHFVVDRLPYCDVHAAGPVRRRAQRQGAEGVEAKAKKRQTIITRS